MLAQVNGEHYLYTYDGAGNITSRIKTIVRRNQKALVRDEGEETLINIRANATWSEVQVVINEEVKDGDMLYIYTERGLLVASLRLESNNTSFNLSNFKKGTYLFRYSRNKNITESKIIKTY
jgi:YD repeat-containing protein